MSASRRDRARETAVASNEGGALVGADVGATLAKLAIRSDGRTRYASFPASAVDRIAAEIRAASPASVGVTGGGAPELAELVDQATVWIDEFRAWGAGAGVLIGEQELSVGDRYLLVSLGTGTSVLLVEAAGATRVGGTALGGGTAVGLGAALAGCATFEDLCRLASRGDRRCVDLLVSDIYRRQSLPLAGDLTAASFGKLALGADGAGRPEDMAAAVMGLVGENVALICGGLAAATGARRVVFGGSTLRENPALGDVLLSISRMTGLEASLLRDGEFAGALGALELASRPAGPARSEP